MKALITGAGGFMGLFLLEYLSKQGFEVRGTYFSQTSNIKNFNGEDFEEKFTMVQCDIRNKEKLKQILAEFKPDRIYHLAAQSYPTVSWEKPAYTIEVNVIGTINLFESIKELKLNTVVMSACSSAEYGFVEPEEVPIKESHTRKPLHPYGVSKVAQEMLGYQYFKNFGIKVINARIFNTTGPRKVNDVCSDFASQLARIELGLQEPIMRVGNLETKRAIIDVRDIIRAFYFLTDKGGEVGESYNLSGSKVYKIGDLLNTLFSMSKAKPKIKVDPKLIRPTDEPIIYGDSSKLEKDTNWKQEIPIEQTLKDMLNYWRNYYETSGKS